MGGYPRPQFEIISSKWSVGPLDKMHPNLFTQINPSLDMADILYQKSGDTEAKRRVIMTEMAKFSMKKKQLESNKQMF